MDEPGVQCTVCRLCINWYGTGGRGGGEGITNPSTPKAPPQSYVHCTNTHSLADSVTINVKTPVHCSPDSSMLKSNVGSSANFNDSEKTWSSLFIGTSVIAF